MQFALEALQANDGDCLLLHFAGGAGDAVTRVLIDGGSRGIYKNVLKPRLDALRGQDPLDLRMVMVSHIDADHITGIVDLFKVLSEQQNAGDISSIFVRAAGLRFQKAASFAWNAVRRFSDVVRRAVARTLQVPSSAWNAVRNCR